MSDWTFITNHGAVLAVIGEQQQTTARSIAQTLGITERSVQRIIRDLESAGYITKEKEGRSNRYSIIEHLPLRRHERRDVLVGDLLRVLNRAVVGVLNETASEHTAVG